MNLAPTPSVLADRLWHAVAAGDEHKAARTAYDALATGVSAETLLLEVIAPVQERIGVEWAADRITVAQEHAATAINERVIALLAHHPESAPPTECHGRLIVSCVDGEWHALPARLLAEVLALHGWKVDYLGAQTPTPHLIAHLHHVNPDAVLLSGSIPTHLPTAHAAITACQAVGVPVLVGGRAFGRDGRYSKALHADGWARDAHGALAVLQKQLPRPDVSITRQAVDDLPHLADQEYTLVTRNRATLVKQALAHLEDRIPAVRDYSDVQRDHTAEDLAHIIDFLATALYVNDSDLFTEFLTWTAEILDARKIPARSLQVALEILTEQLHDFPRSLHLLQDGTLALNQHAASSPHTNPDSSALV